MNKNRWVKVTGVLLSLCLLFSMMSVMAGAEELSRAKLTSIKLQYVNYPVDGVSPMDFGNPVAMEDDHTGIIDYSVDWVEWYNETDSCDVEFDDVFEAGKTYCMKIHLFANTTSEYEHYFDKDYRGLPILEFIHFNGESVIDDVEVYFENESTDTEIYIQMRLEALERKLVKDVAVDEIEVPVPGAKPDYDVVAGDTGYELHEAGAEWLYKYAEDDYRYVPDDEDFVFEEGEEYMVKIWLTRTDDYIFDLNEITATVNGETAEVNPASAETVIAVDYYFGECTAPIEEDTTSAEEDTTAAEETTAAPEETTKAPETTAAPTTAKPAETTAAPTTAAPVTTAKPVETTAKAEAKPKVKKPAKVKIKTAKSLKKKSAVITWAKVKTANGYQVAYSTSKKFTKKATKTKLIKKVKTVKTTIKKLKSGKKYFVKVRAYKTVEGKKLYGNYSKVKTVKVK